MPTVAPLAKVDKCRALGANVIVHGAHIGEAKEWAMENPELAEMHYINGYDDPEIIAGAGTLAIEALEKDDDWFNSLKTWSVEYLRYDGCARDGSDPDGAVAKAHAARKVGDTDAAVEAEQAKKKEIGKARRARKREAEAEAEAEAINR